MWNRIRRRGLCLVTCVVAVCAGSHKTYILFLSEAWAQMIETGEGPDKTAQVEPAPDFLMCGVQGHWESDQTHRLSFLFPWSEDKWRQLSRLTFPWQAPAKLVFVPHTFFMFDRWLLCFLFKTSSRRSESLFVFEFLRSPQVIKGSREFVSNGSFSLL